MFLVTDLARYMTNFVTSQGDIHVAIVQQGAADARAIVYYKESSVPSKLSKSMLHSFCHIFASIQENPSQIVESIDYCSTYDQKLMTQFTRAMSKRQDACIHDMALRFSSITPNATAVCSWDGDLTYKDLDRMTSQLAHYLIQKGVGPEVFVLSCFEKSKWPIVARLAISRAGGAYVSIDASDPPVYLGSIIQRTQAQVLLTTGKFVDQFRGLVPTLIELSTDMVQNLPTHETPPKTEVHSHNACLILFTSGSTGEPKGIVQEHGSYATAIRDYANALGLTSSTRMLQYDHYASDISNNDYLVALSVGGCCCVPFPKTRVLEYQEEITRMKVNITFLTPTDAVQFDPEAVQCLETICLGGEALPQDLVRKWHGKVKMVNQYGMSELATCCILNDTVHPDKEVNLGRPRTGAVWVVSLANPEQLMPVGAVGELIMEGPHLSRGYIDTVCPKSASFLRQIPTWMESVQPFRKPERMYLSGDLGKYNHDGTITYMGRKDTILKVNGERIDAAEVEYCARKCLSSGDMIVVGILGPFHKSDGPQLVAYIYLKGNSSDQTRQSNEEVTFLSQFENDEFNKIAEAVKSVLYSSLPSYMVPTLFIQVSRIPRTRSNKTDSRKLDQLSQSRFRKVRISKL